MAERRVSSSPEAESEAEVSDKTPITLKLGLIGKSILNQRIERFWRDHFTGCVYSFYTLFRNLEEVGLLNIDDSGDMFALHYVYIPLINQALCCFVEGWCHHKIRTENNRTPLQLWISGSMARTESGLDDYPLSEVSI